MSWANDLGKKIIKEIKIEIPSAFIYHTKKTCDKCNKVFIYENTDNLEKLQRQMYFNKSGNLDVCLDCDVYNIFFPQPKPKKNQTSQIINQIHTYGFWYVDLKADLEQILDNKPNKIKVKYIKKSQIFIKDNILYTITSISLCKVKHKKINFCAYNKELNKKIYLVYPINYLLDLDSESNIIVK